MAKLVIGTNKQTVVPAFVRDMSPTYYVEKTVVDGKLVTSTNIINLNNVTDLGTYVLRYGYAWVIFPVNTTVDFSSLTEISGSYALASCFRYADNITSVNLSNLQVISGVYACSSAFFEITELTSVDLSSLTTISGQNACEYMFGGCSNLRTINLNSLTTISGYSAVDNMFKGCSLLSSVKLNALTNIIQFGTSLYRVFPDCPKLESVELGGLKSTTFSSDVNLLRYMFDTSTGSTATNGCTVHFPSNFDPDNPDKTFDITTLTGYPTFGGSASYIHVAFDLAATE